MNASLLEVGGFCEKVATNLGQIAQEPRDSGEPVIQRIDRQLRFHFLQNAPMAFKDRPYFRRILDFDDMMRRKEQVTYEVLAKAWETSPKTIQRFIKHMRLEFQAPIKFDSKRGSFCYTDETYRLPWLPVEGKDLFAIGGFILSFGRHAVAVSPQTLVDEMCTEISAMAARYPRT